MTTESAPSTPDTPAPSAAPSKAERRDALRKQIAAPSQPKQAHAIPEPTPATTRDESSEAPAEAKAPTPSRLERARQALAAKAEERRQRAAIESRDRELQELRQRVDHSSREREPTAKELLAEFERNPAETLRKYGKDVAKTLEALTKDTLAPGSIAAAYAAEDGTKAAKEVAERVERLEAQLQAERDAAQGERNAREFIELTSDAETFPHTAKLKPHRRIALAMEVWGEMRSKGLPYDRDVVAQYVEGILEEDYFEKHDSAEQPKTPPQSEVDDPKPQVTAKPPKTITPKLKAETGTSRAKSYAEKRQEWRRQISGD